MELTSGTRYALRRPGGTGRLGRIPTSGPRRWAGSQRRGPLVSRADHDGCARKPGMATPSSTVNRAAPAFRLDPSRLRPLGGHSGSAWDAGNRLLWPGTARGLTPSTRPLRPPPVMPAAEFGVMAAVLLERLPVSWPSVWPCAGQHRRGRSASPATRCMPCSPGCPLRGGCLPPGRRCRCLGTGPAPAEHPGQQRRRDHGVLDWANAAAGNPLLDRAWSCADSGPGRVGRAGRDPGQRACLGIPASAAATERPSSTAEHLDMPRPERAGSPTARQAGG
jgi:hypothetical protein